jgi:hypothetical protein
LQAANSSTNRQGHEDLIGRAANDIQDDRALLMAGCDVEKYQFVSSLAFIASRHLNRISRISQIDEICPLNNSASIHVQAGNHSLG